MVLGENNPNGEQVNIDAKPDIPEINEVLEKKETWRLKDIKGFIHFHSGEGSSCGKDDIFRIKDSIAGRTGLQYIGFAEHVGWPGEEYWQDKILTEYENIDQANAEHTVPRIFKGIEANVLPDGTLDASQELIEKSEIVVASIHYKNTDRPEEITAQNTVDRWVKVMDSYSEVNVLGHPLRDLPVEEWPKMDWDTLCAKAKEKNIAIELSISDSAPAELPREFFRALRKYDNLVVIAPDFHNLSSYLVKDGDLPVEKQKLLDEYYKLKGEIAGITFNKGEEVKGRGIDKPTYTEKEKEAKRLKLQNLRGRLQEIEDGEELAKIYEILASNIKFNQDETGNISTEKNPLSFKMLRKYAKRMDRLRKPVDETGQLAISKDNIVNLWNKDKFADWIKTRKNLAVINNSIINE